MNIASQLKRFSGMILLVKDRSYSEIPDIISKTFIVLDLVLIRVQIMKEHNTVIRILSRSVQTNGMYVEYTNQLNEIREVISDKETK